MDQERLPGREITQTNDPIRWLQEMADTSAMQCLPSEMRSLIIDAVFALGDTWPAPIGALEVLAGHLHDAQTDLDAPLRDETMDDLLEIYQFVVRAIQDCARTLEPVAVRTCEELAQDIVKYCHREIVSLTEAQLALNRDDDHPSPERVAAAIESLEDEGVVWCLFNRYGVLMGYHVQPSPVEPIIEIDDDDVPF